MRIVLLSLLMLWLFTGCQEETEVIKPSGKVIEIGVVFAKNDSLMQKRLSVLNYFEKSRGLLHNGDKLRIHAVSTEGDALNCFNNLILEYKPVIILSFLDSTAMLELKETIEKSKIPIVSMIATHSKINEIEYVSRICLNNPWQASVAAAYIRDELFVANVDIVTDDRNDFSLELSSLFTQKYEKMGGKISLTFYTKELEKNPQQFINEMNERNIDMLFITIDAEKTRMLLKILDKVDHKVQILAHDGLLSTFKTRFPEDVKLLNKMLVIDNYADDVDISKKAEAFHLHMQDKKDRLDSYDGLSFDAWSLMTKALNTCQNNSSLCLNQKMRNMQKVNGIVETFRMQDGNAFRPVYVNEIYKGKMKEKVKVY